FDPLDLFRAQEEHFAARLHDHAHVAIALRSQLRDHVAEERAERWLLRDVGVRRAIRGRLHARGIHQAKWQIAVRFEWLLAVECEQIRNTGSRKAHRLVSASEE